MSDEEVMLSDSFYPSDDETMTPLINWAMKEDAKPPDLNEKSNIVFKKCVDVQENLTQPEDITDIIGKSGLWQIKILLLTMLIGFPCAWNHLGMCFLAYPVDHWCAKPADLNVSLDVWLSEFLPNVTLKGKIHHSQCEMYVLNDTAISPVKSRTVRCDTYEYSSDFNSIVNKWDIVCSENWLLSTSQTVYMIGFLITAFLSGHFADKFGRHPAIMVNIVILIAAGFAAAFSNSFMMFTISRFFIAVGNAGVALVTYILLIEVVGSSYRVLYMFLHGIGWHLGYMIIPLIAWYEPDWFILQMAMTVPTIFLLSFYWLLPESPRWLLANGYTKDALIVLEKAAKMNGRNTTDLECQVKLIEKLNSKGKENPYMTTCFDLLRTPNLRTKTLCLYFIWAVIAFTYYGLSLNTNELEGNDFVNFFLSGLMEIPATVLCIVTLNRFGRKKPLFISLLFGGLACFACIFIPIRLSGVKTGLAMVGKMFVSGSFAIIYLFSSEIFPTVARNIGVGSSSTVARIGSSVAPFMRDLGNVTNPYVPLVIFGALSIISALIVLRMPETNNQPIPESMDQAEKFGQEETSGSGTSRNTKI